MNLPSQKIALVAVVAATLQGCAQLSERMSVDGETQATAIGETASGRVANGAAEAPEHQAVAWDAYNFWASVADRRLAGIANMDDEPDDLWERIRDGFELPDRGHRQALKYARWYASRPHYLAQVMERAEAYLYLVAEEIEKRGMPMELALLPVVESAYHPFAYSPSHAAGLWQFVPATARHYGLKRTSSYDGRRDVVASTRAALDYLQKLNADFDGDWLRAVAAYNCGEGAVQRAIEANRRKGRRTDFWSLDLPSEARAYVPSLLGISAVVANPTRFSVTLKPIANNPYLAEVDAGAPMRLTEVARMAGIPLDEVHRLNAGYHRGVTGLEGAHRLLLPVDRIEIFKQRLARSNPKAAERLAARSANSPLLAVADRRQVSRTYQVAVVRAETDAGTDTGTDTGTSEPLSATAGARTQVWDEPPRLHTVTRDETLWRIARHYHASVQQLRAWNRLGPRGVIRAGQTLVVRPGTAVAHEESPDRSATPASSVPGQAEQRAEVPWPIRDHLKVDARNPRTSQPPRLPGGTQADRPLSFYTDGFHHGLARAMWPDSAATAC